MEIRSIEINGDGISPEEVQELREQPHIKAAEERAHDGAVVIQRAPNGSLVEIIVDKSIDKATLAAALSEGRGQIAELLTAMPGNLFHFSDNGRNSLTIAVTLENGAVLEIPRPHGDELPAA